MIHQPVLIEVAKDTYMIDLMGLQSPTLIVGGERALLIDTGLGNFDLMSIVRRVTDKPIQLVLTHAHSDHMGGIGQFQEIYMHPADIPVAETFASDRRIREMNPPPTQAEFVAQVAAEWRARPENIFDIPDTVVEDRFSCQRFIPLKPNQILDLGGRKVKILEERGHTPGEIAILDFQSRILFAGDGLGPRFSVTASDIGTVQKDLLNIRTHASEFDRIYHGHFAALDPTTLCSDSIALLDAVLKIVTDAVEGVDPGEPAGSEILRTRSYDGVQLYWNRPE